MRTIGDVFLGVMVLALVALAAFYVPGEMNTGFTDTETGTLAFTASSNTSDYPNPHNSTIPEPPQNSTEGDANGTLG